MAKRNFKGNPRPEGKVRQSQLLTGYGPGAMIDLVEHSVLVGGLDHWHYDGVRGSFTVEEPRLREAVMRLLKDSGVEVDASFGFRLPPTGEDRDASRASGIRVLEFPQWFVCQNEACRALVHSRPLDVKKGGYVHQCERGRESPCVPVRFVAACKNGHLDEFDWIGFVHDRKPRCPSPQLKLSEGATGDFSELIVKCSCGVERSLSQATVPEANRTCRGARPWLGSEGQEPCTEKVRLLVTTASNAYFSQTMSALSIPDPDGDVLKSVQQAWDVLVNATAETLPAFRTIPKVQAAVARFSDQQVLAAAKKLKGEDADKPEPLRRVEFRQLVQQPFEAVGDLPRDDDTFFARQITVPDAIKREVCRIVLVPRLREVQAQVGFTRIEPATPDLQGEYDLGVRSARLGLQTNWLPATEYLGEGVFIQLDEDRLWEWEQRPAVQARAAQLLKGYDTWAAEMSTAPPFPGARYYLLHSLSHMLMSAISLECGYSQSALRERIYCDHHLSTSPMAGLLIETGTPGSEGTLGGLVEQGRALLGHLRNAHDAACLCSNDPVCAGHSPDDDPVGRWLDGAACHGCLYIAECSCERFNKYLDRALLVPTMGHDPELAFFGRRP